MRCTTTRNYVYKNNIIFKNSPYIPFVGAVFDMVAQGLEHTACSCHLSTIEYLLHTNHFNMSHRPMSTQRNGLLDILIGIKLKGLDILHVVFLVLYYVNIHLCYYKSFPIISNSRGNSYYLQ